MSTIKRLQSQTKDVANWETTIASRPWGRDIDHLGLAVTCQAKIAARVRALHEAASRPGVAIRPLLIALLALASSLIGSTAHAAWTTQTVAHFGDMGIESSLTLDSQGRPHIAYLESDYLNFTYSLYYAFWDGAAWKTTRLARAGDSSGPTSLALDSKDQPRICFSYQKLGARPILYVAELNGSTWTAHGIDYGIAWSLDLDGLGTIHISYFNPYSVRLNDQDVLQGDLKYAFGTGKTWQIETVEYGGRVGEWSSIAVDPVSGPRIAYRDFGTIHGALKLATKSGAAWATEVVDSRDDAGRNPSLAVDSQGRPCISYAGGDNSLRFARRGGTSWEIEVVDVAVGYYSLPNSLALDHLDRPHISYQTTTPHLKYAVRNGGTWQRETVDTINSPGQFNSIAVDSRNRPHVAYYEVIEGDLKHATMSESTLVVAKAGSGGGTITSVPGGIDCGTICSATIKTSQSVTLEATPGNGSAFLGWSGDCTGETSTTVVVTDRFRSCIAAFGAESTPNTTNPAPAGGSPEPGVAGAPSSGMGPSLGGASFQVATTSMGGTGLTVPSSGGQPNGEGGKPADGGAASGTLGVAVASAGGTQPTATGVEGEPSGGRSDRESAPGAEAAAGVGSSTGTIAVDTENEHLGGQLISAGSSSKDRLPRGGEYLGQSGGSAYPGTTVKEGAGCGCHIPIGRSGAPLTGLAAIGAVLVLLRRQKRSDPCGPYSSSCEEGATGHDQLMRPRPPR